MKTTFKTKDLIPALEEAIKKEEEKKEALWEEFIKEEEKRDEEYKRNLGAWRVKRKSLFSPREPMPIPPPFNWGDSRPIYISNIGELRDMLRFASDPRIETVELSDDEYRIIFPKQESHQNVLPDIQPPSEQC